MPADSNSSHSSTARGMRPASCAGHSLLAAVARCASNTHIPDCLPSTSSAGWPVWALCTRGSVTTAAVASPQVQPQPSLDVDYARRINEMLAAQAARQRQQEQQQQLEQLQRRRLDLDSIPVLQLPRQQQQQQQPQPLDAEKPAVDWRQVVEHVRRSGQTVTGQQMLTDKFRWARKSCMHCHPLLCLSCRALGTTPPAPASASHARMHSHARPLAQPPLPWPCFNPLPSPPVHPSPPRRRTHTYLRISLTERCNLRCTYCMPADGVDLTPSQRLMSPDEVERLVSGVALLRVGGGQGGE